MTSMDTVETIQDPSTPATSKLEKQLGLWDVYALATGATLSSGFFLLPGLAAAGAGSAMPLSYLLAASIVAPGLLCSVELTTAMPKAGGIYYFLDRSMGPLVGTIGGFGTWIALVLKSAFALIGVVAYLQLFLPNLPAEPVAAALAVGFGLINYLGAKKTGRAQVILLIGLLILLSWFSGYGILNVDGSAVQGIFQPETAGLVSTAGLVIVSYMGLTKVASVAEEVKNPEKNIPLGTFLAFGTAIFFYVIGTVVMIGVTGADVLGAGYGDLTPVATVAGELVDGRAGVIVMTIAALLAIASGANAGILSASRYPLAMGRDRLLPDFFAKVGKSTGAPTIGIIATVGVIVLCVTTFDPTGIAKLASAFKLVMFALGCLAVIVMRESRIESYDPGYRSPFYPMMQIVGILAPFWLIVEMGFMPTLFTFALITLGAAWFTYYAKARVDREGAIFHVFERLGRQRDDRLDIELREIIKDRGPRQADPFDALFAEAKVIDVEGRIDFETLARQAGDALANGDGVTGEELAEGFLTGTRLGATPVSHGAALPHVRLDRIEHPSVLLARVSGGVEFEGVSKAMADDAEPVYAVFFLIGPDSDPGRHLRILAQMARRVDQDVFMPEWLGAEGPTQIKEALFRNERLLVLQLDDDPTVQPLIGAEIRTVSLPDGTLIAMIRREDEMVIPRGGTVLERGDRLTILGDPGGIAALYDRFGGAAS